MTTNPPRYDDFAILLEGSENGTFVSRILHSVAGGGAVAFELPVPADQLDELMDRIGAHVRGSSSAQTAVSEAEEESAPAYADPEDLGQALHRAIMGGRVSEAWAYHLGTLAGAADRGLRLRLVIDPDSLEGSHLATYPWELIHLGRARGYLARSRLTPLVRYLDVEQPTVLPPIEEPLRILVLAASPTHHPRLDIADEEEKIRDAWGTAAPAEVTFVRGLSPEELRERLLRGRFHVLHFIGHGEFSESPSGSAEGALIFENFYGWPETVSASTLAEVTRDLRHLRLVVLGACDSARFPRHRGADPYSGVAAALVLAGVPAVVAMQFPVSDDAAIAFGGALYRALAASDPVDAAVTEGRIAMRLGNDQSLEWAIPVLFSRLAPGTILGDRGSRGGPSALRERVRDASELIEARTRGFVGRRWLFDAIETFRREERHGYFKIVAEPGMGKTAIMAEMVRRHGWVHHFNVRRSSVIRPETFLSNVCAQLILAHGLDVPDLPPEALRGGGYLCEILGRVSARLEPGQTVVVLVDALDESSRDGLERGVNPLYLPSRLPDGIVVVVTTRPENPEETSQFDEPTELLELKEGCPENRADVREYLESFLPGPGIRRYLKSKALRDDLFTEEMVDRSASNFMYLSLVLPAIERGDYDGRSFDEIPAGLKRYYEDHFARMRGDDREVWLQETLPVLSALAVAKDAIPLPIIQAYSGLEDRRRVVEALGQLRQFLAVTQRQTPAGPLIVRRFYHESFFDFMRDNEIVAADPDDARKRLALAYADGKLEELTGFGVVEGLLAQD